MKNEVLSECYKQIRKANRLDISDEDRARICDVVFENVPDLEEIEPAALGDTFPNGSELRMWGSAIAPSATNASS